MSDVGDKPLAPSRSRREAARRSGDVAFSPVLVSAAALLAGTLALTWLGPGAATRLVGLSRRAWGNTTMDGVHAAVGMTASPAQLIDEAWQWAAGLALPVLGAALLGAVAAGWAQTRGLLSLGALVRPRRREGGAKWIALAAAVAVALVLLREGPAWTALARTGGGTTLAAATRLIGRMALRTGLVLLAAGLAEYALAWWRRERSLRMTHAEAAEEARADTGDPRWRAELRRRHR